MATFLIVDPDRNFREALAIALRLDGHVVTAAATADEALARLESGGHACVVVDAHLWDADAVLGAAERSGLRAVLTGPYADLLAHAARRHPFAEPLAKPFPAAALAAAAG